MLIGRAAHTQREAQEQEERDRITALQMPQPPPRPLPSRFKKSFLSLAKERFVENRETLF